MFGISFYELLVIFVIAVVLFKPSNFITILFSLGKVVKKIKNFISSFQEDIDKLADLGDINDYVIKEKVKSGNKNVSSKNNHDN